MGARILQCCHTKNPPRGIPRRGQQPGSAGMPNLCPYPANNPALATELDFDLSLICIPQAATFSSLFIAL